LRAFKFVMISVALLSLALAKPAFSASLSLVVAMDRQGALYDVGNTVTFTGSVSNGSIVPDALVLFEVDGPKHSPWIIRTFTTGHTPAGPWPVELLSVTPTDKDGNPKYSFQPGQDAGFNVTLKNNALTPCPVVVTINLFFSNGLPFVLQPVVSTTLQPGQVLSAVTWPVNIPANSVVGQAMVFASVFDDYPKNNGLPYSPERSAAFNIASGTPAQAPKTSPLGTFNLAVPLTSTSSVPIWLGNYTVYAMTHYGYSLASAQTIFSVKLIGDMNGDGKIDMKDVAEVARAFGSRLGDPSWNPAADLTGPIPFVPDGIIDMRDVALVGKAFGLVAKSGS
jgi:hypothetical protein